MSWRDPERCTESEADTALREELRALLGIQAQPANFFETEPEPDTIRLADDLRREALRRRHTARTRRSWMLTAAALPLTAALAGLATWGTVQKHRADVLTAAVAHQESEIQRLATAIHQVPAAPAPTQVARVVPVAPGRPHARNSRSASAPVFLLGEASPKGKPKELVIPVERPATTDPSDTERVKAH